MAAGGVRRSLLDLMARPWTFSRLLDEPVFNRGWHDAGRRSEWDELLRLASAAQSQDMAAYHDAYMRDTVDIAWDGGSVVDERHWTRTDGTFKSPASAFLPAASQAASFALFDSKVAFQPGRTPAHPAPESVDSSGASQESGIGASGIGASGIGASGIGSRWRAVLGRGAGKAATATAASAAAAGDAVVGENADRVRPLVVILAPTGDHGFQRRRLLYAQPLAKMGISSIVLEAPYYGARKPDDQFRSSLHHVSNLFSMGVALVSECASLYNTLEADRRFNLFGVAGASLGGQMACHVASAVDRPLALVPVITPISAGPVFCDGVLASWCDWEALDRTLGAFADSVAPPPGADAHTSKTFMRAILDYMTLLTRFPPPNHPRATVQIAARADAYVPEPDEGAKLLQAHYPGSQLWMVNSGHVGTVAFHSGLKCKAIHEAFSVLVRDQAHVPRGRKGPDRR